MLTTTGRIVIIIVGAAIGLGAGVAAMSVASTLLAPPIGFAVGAVGAYLLTTLWK